MSIKLRTQRYFTIPYSLFESLLQMRGAIDPDSGQIVCHFYSLGVSVLETPAGPVPIVVIEGCLMVTFGKENVETLLAGGSAVEVGAFSVKDGQIYVGDVAIDNTWGLAAIAYAGELGTHVRLYKLRMSVDDGEEAPIAGIYVETEDGIPVLLLIPSSCEYVEIEEERPPTHM
jgi:hypothetical protein